MLLFSLLYFLSFLSQAQWEGSREALLTTPWVARLSQHPPLPCGPASTVPSWTSLARSTARCAACPVVKEKTPPPWQTGAGVGFNLFSKLLPLTHSPPSHSHQNSAHFISACPGLLWECQWCARLRVQSYQWLCSRSLFAVATRHAGIDLGKALGQGFFLSAFQYELTALLLSGRWWNSLNLFLELNLCPHP